MRDIPVGNGSLLVNFDDKYQIRDIYFPHVGQENHSEGFPFRFGILVDGTFSWISSPDWTRQLLYLPETLVTDVKLTNPSLGIEIVCNDTVASHDNIFLRRVEVRDLEDKTREIRIFLHHDFRIYENEVGDTAYYDPDCLALIHYKKNRYFLINTEPHFNSFATGRKAFGDQEGTWRDAESGHLRGGAITEGSVDSTIGVHFDLAPSQKKEFFYWIAAGTSHADVTELNKYILDRRPQRFLDYSANYWRAWVNKNDTDLADLPANIVDLYKRSLLIAFTQIDHGGAILAANDSDVTARATDHYSYLWTRDGAFIANALDMAGYPGISRRFYELCLTIVHNDGYFLQKYNADGTVASGWHAAWDIYGSKKLTPIQEDETALVLWALWHHYDMYRDIEFAHRVYRKLIVRCADFMVRFRRSDLNLPQPSWNLWENQRGIHTFTCSTVVAGLRAAAMFAKLFADTERFDNYEIAANEIVAGMREHLYDSSKGRFLRSLNFHGDDHFEADDRVDASLFGTFYFGAFSPNDEMVVNTIRAIEETLLSSSPFGGVARFQDDDYVRASNLITGNSWFICSQWLAEFYIATANSEHELEKALDILRWTVDRARPSGILAEQLDPATGEHLSVSPLTWSHSTFVSTVLNYIRKLRQLRF